MVGFNTGSGRDGAQSEAEYRSIGSIEVNEDDGRTVRYDLQAKPNEQADVGMLSLYLQSIFADGEDTVGSGSDARCFSRVGEGAESTLILGAYGVSELDSIKILINKAKEDLTNSRCKQALFIYNEGVHFLVGHMVKDPNGRIVLDIHNGKLLDDNLLTTYLCSMQDVTVNQSKSQSIQCHTNTCGFAAMAQLEHMVQHGTFKEKLSRKEESAMVKKVCLNWLTQNYVSDHNVCRILGPDGKVVEIPTAAIKRKLYELIDERNQQLLNQTNQIHIKQEEKHMTGEKSGIVSRGTQASLTEETVDEFKEKNEKLEKGIEKLNTDQIDLNNKLIRKEKQLEEVISQATTLEGENTQLREKLDKKLTENENLESKIARLETEQKELYAEITQVKSHNETLSSNYRILSERPLKTTADQGTQAVADILKTVSDARSVNNGYVQDIAKLHNEIVERDQELEQATKKIEALEQSLRKLKISQGSTKNIQSSREDMEDADILTIIRKAEKLYGALQAYSNFKRDSDKDNEALRTKHRVADKTAKRHLLHIRIDREQRFACSVNGNSHRS